MLFQQGLLVREQGRGTFVAPQGEKTGQNAHQFMGFTELMKRHHKKGSAKLLEIKTEAPSRKVRRLLELKETDKVVRVERLRFGDHEPLIIERFYFAHDLFHPLLNHDLENQSIYEVLYRETDIRLGDAKQTIEAVIATPWRANCSKSTPAHR
jgi:GntR family transcriptional regulator